MEWTPLILSFQIAILATIVAAVIGIAIATLLANVKFPGRDLLDVVVTTPMVLPPTVLGYYVLTAIGRRSFIGRWYEDLTGGDTIVFTFTGAVIAAAIGALPLIAKASRTALEGVNRRYVQAARTLGAGRMRAFFTVQLPLAWPGVVSGIMLGFARSLGDFGLTLMIAGDIPGETRTASLAIYNAIQGNRDADAIGMVLVLSAIALVALYGVTKLTRPAQDAER